MMLLSTSLPYVTIPLLEGHSPTNRLFLLGVLVLNPKLSVKLSWGDTTRLPRNLFRCLHAISGPGALILTNCNFFFFGSLVTLIVAICLFRWAVSSSPLR